MNRIIFVYSLRFLKTAQLLTLLALFQQPEEQLVGWKAADFAGKLSGTRTVPWGTRSRLGERCNVP